MIYLKAVPILIIIGLLVFIGYKISDQANEIERLQTEIGAQTVLIKKAKVDELQKKLIPAVEELNKAVKEYQEAVKEYRRGNHE